MTKDEYRIDFAKLLDIYKDSNMALNKNLVSLMSKYINELEAPKSCDGCVDEAYTNHLTCMYCNRQGTDCYRPKDIK